MNQELADDNVLGYTAGCFMTWDMIFYGPLWHWQPVL